jgi:hypothetical protein
MSEQAGCSYGKVQKIMRAGASSRRAACEISWNPRRLLCALITSSFVEPEGLSDVGLAALGRFERLKGGPYEIEEGAILLIVDAPARVLAR